MKLLKGTAAWIEGKKYKEGSTIPQKYEKEFEQYLVEVPATTSAVKTKEAPKVKDPKDLH
ncbi:MAG: hypothetical protein IH618_15690 [Ignavibacteriaceae bacterium]|nr:hypothetical protein [Ignavibacteriaceae bacterium]